MRRLCRNALLITAILSVVGSTVVADDPAAASQADAQSVAGFDVDGYADLVIGIPGEWIGGLEEAGAVGVIYGSGAGLRAAGNQFWHQDVVNVAGDPELGDRFGHSLTIGDFDGDGFADLAIGIPNETVGLDPNAGAVQVLYGLPEYLSSVGSQLWSQDSPYVLDPAEDGDTFGEAVATGDFDADGYDDLAIGVPREDFGSATDAGMVHILYGSAGGLHSDRNIIVHQDLAGTANAAENFDQFGKVLTAGDFNNDGFDDLAVGIWAEDNGAVGNSGAVHIFYGSATGIDPEQDAFFHQNTAGMEDSTEDGDLFGYSLAAGDFDGNGFDDLAVGVYSEDIETVADAGAVHVLYGTAIGLTTVGNKLWHQNIPGMANAAEPADYFGTSVAAGDFDDDGFDDLAVGVSQEHNGTIPNSGAVHVLYGTGVGLDADRNWFLHQNTPGMLDETENADYFGYSVAVGGFNGDAFADLAIGIFYEGVGVSDIRCGAVSVVLGSATGLTADGNQLWHQDSAGILNDCDADDYFGSSLAAVPPTGLFLDDFETGDTSRWSSESP